MTTVYRADIVGSLLRPDYLVRARGQFESGEMATGDLQGDSKKPAPLSPHQLALSTQCGFASAGPGNSVSDEAEGRKLRLIAEVAARVWG